MCGRFAIRYTDDFGERFEVDVDALGFELKDRYNVAPGQVYPVVMRRTDERLLVPMRWGLVPAWAKDESMGNRLINARSESVAEKPSFRKPFLSQRCLVPASGFYEWQQTSQGKQPTYIRRADEGYFAMAGLYDVWKDSEGRVMQTFTILTTEPNDLLRPIHDRMPVILRSGSEAMWLNFDLEPHELHTLLALGDDEEYVVYPVSKLVNNISVEGPELIHRVEELSLF